MSGAEEAKWPTSVAEKRGDDRWHADRFRPTVWSALQARRIKLWLALVGKGLLRLNIEVEGLELVPRGEPLIVAAAPHRNWIDPFLILLALPPLPRTYFLAAADTPGNRWWKRLLIESGRWHGSRRHQRSAQSGRARADAGHPRAREPRRHLPGGWGAKPDPRSCPSSAAPRSSASTPVAGCCRLLSPARRTSGAARRYGYGSRRRSTRFHREPTATTSRPSSTPCARCCKRQLPRSRKSHWTERNRGDG